MEKRIMVIKAINGLKIVPGISGPLTITVNLLRFVRDLLGQFRDHL